MAHIDYIEPVEAAHGRIKKNSEIYFTKRWGKKYQSNYPLHKDPKKITNLQRAQQSAFKEADAEMKRQLSDPVLAAKWREKFEFHLAHPQAGQKQYKIFRNFVLAKIVLQTKNPE